MGFLDTIIGTPFERLKLNNLLQAEVRLQNDIALLKKDFPKIEEDKTDIFKQGIGADSIKKKTLIDHFKNLDFHAQVKYEQLAEMNNQYMFISNLVVIKKYEKEFKQTPIWDNLKNIGLKHNENLVLALKTVNLQGKRLYFALRTVNLQGKSFDEVLDNLNNMENNLNRPFEEIIINCDGEEDYDILYPFDRYIDKHTVDAEKQLINAWSSVETGANGIEDAQKIISTKKHPEQKDTERS